MPLFDRPVWLAWNLRHLCSRLAAACVVAVLALAPAHAQTPAPGSVSLPEVTLRVVVTNSPEEAAQVVERLGRGDEFAAVAREVSIDPTAGRGGLIGRVTPSTLRPELQAALRGLAPGQVSPVVRIPTGFAVLRIEPDGEAAPGGAVALPAAQPNPGLSATGSVKYVAEVSGFGEARTALKQFRKPAGWNQDPQRICDVRRESVAEMLRSLDRHLATIDAGPGAASAKDLMQTHLGIGLLYAYDGRMLESIGHLQEAYRTAATGVPDATMFLEQALGIAHLHQAVIENGVQEAPGERFLITASRHPAFEKTGHAERAVEHFLKYLSSRPDDLEVKWLLNLAYRATGGYPEKVPPAHLIAPDVFASPEDVGRFVDVAPRLGLDDVAAAGGLIVDDFTGDGDLEAVASSMDSCAPVRLFRRDAGGTFVNQAAQAGLADQLGGLNLVQADYDNDGCLDILLLRGGWDEPQRKSLLRNNCDGTFSDVTAASGLAVPATSTQTAVWLDVDNDGFLDLFVGNENAPAQLFLNRRDGTFVDVAGPAGVARSGFIKGVTAGDFDNDGWTDLYVADVSGHNTLYRNSGVGTFTDVTKAAGVADPYRAFATWFFDYDNDGWPDLFVTSYFLSLDESARTYMGLPNSAETLKLYRNQRDGTFADVTAAVGLDKVFMPMGANFGDMDNDGWLDIYLGTGSPSYAAIVPSVLLRNREGQSFVDVTASSGTGELGKGHGVAFADLDNDGHEEIVFQVGGATPGDVHALRVFHNPGAGRHGHDWLEVSLVGTKSNRSAIGARITVTVQQADGTERSIHRTVGSGGSFGASPLRQHIGIGDAAKILAVETWWPASNTRQRFTDVDVKQWIEISELGTAFVRRPRPARPMPGAQAP
jgi:tetratricopeptide (TPR) repeat protein